MIKKTITYTDYNDVEHTETFYFNLSRTEIVEMEVDVKGGFVNMVQSIIEAQDRKRIIEVFKDLILRSYGEKSEDGKSFIKSDELSARFAQSEAYTELFMELSSDHNAAAEFVNGVIPKPKPNQQPISAPLA